MFSIWYIGVTGAAIPFESGYRRHELRHALHDIREYAHHCSWGTTWLLKRGRKTIARLHSNRFKSAAAREQYRQRQALFAARANTSRKAA